MRGHAGLLAAVLIAVGPAGILLTAVGSRGVTGMTSGDPGRMMGSMMAGSAPETVSPTQAVHLGNVAPAGAQVEPSVNLIRFRGDAQFVVLASPDTGPNMTFHAAGLTDPTIVVPLGARVTIRFINADRDTSHALIVTHAAPPFPYMVMMVAQPAFDGAFATPLGDANGAGMPGETVTFTASVKGHFTYLCPVPGHAQQGMFGDFAVV